MTNVTGQVVMQRAVNVQSEDQVETISIKSSFARGVYLVKVSGRNNESVLTPKISGAVNISSTALQRRPRKGRRFFIAFIHRYRFFTTYIYELCIYV
jgi:hypothetical protein